MRAFRHFSHDFTKILHIAIIQTGINISNIIDIIDDVDVRLNHKFAKGPFVINHPSQKIRNIIQIRLIAVLIMNRAIGKHQIIGPILHIPISIKASIGITMYKKINQNISERFNIIYSISINK